MSATFLIALGSNRRHRCGDPKRVVAAAIEALEHAGLKVTARSRIRTTAPLGPGGRSYANAAVAVTTPLALPALLELLQAIEARFGRRRGQRWGARVLDLDILGSAGSVYPSPHRWHRAQGLVVPHRALALRRFVLDPLVDIAPGWRHPVLHSTARQLRTRLRHPKATAPSP